MIDALALAGGFVAIIAAYRIARSCGTVRPLPLVYHIVLIGGFYVAFTSLGQWLPIWWSFAIVMLIAFVLYYLMVYRNYIKLEENAQK